VLKFIQLQSFQQVSAKHSEFSSVSFSETRRSHITSSTVQCFLPWKKSSADIFWRQLFDPQ